MQERLTDGLSAKVEATIEAEAAARAAIPTSPALAVRPLSTSKRSSAMVMRLS